MANANIVYKRILQMSENEFIVSADLVSTHDKSKIFLFNEASEALTLLGDTKRIIELNKFTYTDEENNSEKLLILGLKSF